MSGETSPQRREPGPWTVLGAVAALLAATACFVGCATEVSALGSGHSTPAAPRTERRDEPADPGTGLALDLVTRPAGRQRRQPAEVISCSAFRAGRSPG